MAVGFEENAGIMMLSKHFHHIHWIIDPLVHPDDAMSL